jgi:hypothetical protein
MAEPCVNCGHPLPKCAGTTRRRSWRGCWRTSVDSAGERPGLRAGSELARRPEQGRQDHRRESDHKADDPACHVLTDQHSTEEDGDGDDPPGRDQAHHAAFHLGAASLAARNHALGTLAMPCRAGRPAGFGGSHLDRVPGRGQPNQERHAEWAEARS